MCAVCSGFFFSGRRRHTRWNCDGSSDVCSSDLAGTHPTAAWTEARQTKAARYDSVMHDLQMIGRRNMLCGLHVHVELPDPDMRVDVMTRMLPYLAIFIALANSSPFWQSQHTGLMGYRLAAYDELP